MLEFLVLAGFSSVHLHAALVRFRLVDSRTVGFEDNPRAERADKRQKHGFPGLWTLQDPPLALRIARRVHATRQRT